jgi:hypothetical protein
VKPEVDCVERIVDSHMHHRVHTRFVARIVRSGWLNAGCECGFAGIHIPIGDSIRHSGLLGEEDQTH